MIESRISYHWINTVERTVFITSRTSLMPKRSLTQPPNRASELRFLTNSIETESGVSQAIEVSRGWDRGFYESEELVDSIHQTTNEVL